MRAPFKASQPARLASGKSGVVGRVSQTGTLFSVAPERLLFGATAGSASDHLAENETTGTVPIRRALAARLLVQSCMITKRSVPSAGRFGPQAAHKGTDASSSACLAARRRHDLWLHALAQP